VLLRVFMVRIREHNCLSHENGGADQGNEVRYQSGGVTSTGAALLEGEHTERSKVFTGGSTSKHYMLTDAPSPLGRSSASNAASSDLTPNIRLLCAAHPWSRETEVALTDSSLQSVSRPRRQLSSRSSERIPAEIRSTQGGRCEDAVDIASLA
jgi:hypothetical protein